MIVFGITGSIGMGKSTAADMLRSMRVPVFCSDSAVHDLLNNNTDVIETIIREYPAAFNFKTKKIDRQKLREELSDDHTQWDNLEHILHPRVQDAQKHFIRTMRSMGQKIIGIDIPLLFETGAESRLDFTICVSAPFFIQQQRVMGRPNANWDDFMFRLNRQMSDEEKRRRADFVVDTGQGRSVTYRQLAAIIRQAKETREPEESAL